jgi:hypothetical protein
MDDLPAIVPKALSAFSQIPFEPFSSALMLIVSDGGEPSMT